MTVLHKVNPANIIYCQGSNLHWPTVEAMNEFWIDKTLHMMDDKAEINRHHRDFQAISDICTNWRNKTLTADEAVNAIQNIVG